MPVISAGDLTTLRTKRHATRLNLCVYNPQTIWTAQVNGAHAAGATSIAVDNVVNTRTPSKHFLVWFGSTAGAHDLGEGRFKSYAAPTLTIGENNVTLPNDSYVTIKEEIKPQAIHWNVTPADVILEDNDTAYTNENSQYMPIARTGSHAVAYLDENTGLATVNFYGSRSTAVAAGATLSSYAWSFRGGTPNTSTVAGTAGAPVTVTWNTAGDYYCSLTVTDSNGKTHTRFFVVFIRSEHGTTNLPLRQLEIGNIEGDVEAGLWKASLKVWSDAADTSFPNQGLCVISADDWFDDARDSISTEPHRENIVMCGYIRSDSIKRDWTSKGSVEFEIESASGTVSNLLGLAGELETSATAPTTWHTLLNMTYNLAAHHVLTQHTTLTQITDCYFNLNSYFIEFVDLPEGSIIDQLTPLCGTTRGRLGSNAQGHFYLEPYPQLIPLASRSTSYTIETTLADFRDELDLGIEQHQRPVAQVQFWGEDQSGNPYSSYAPLYRWMDGLSVETIDNIRVADQSEANTLAGLYEGQRNNPYSEVVINWRGNYRVFDTFPAEPLALNITAAQNNRGVAWTTQRVWIKRVTYEYSAGVLLVSTVVELDTGSPPGTAGIIGDYPPTIPPTPPPPVVIPPTPPPLSVSVIPYDIADGIAISTAIGVTRTLLVMIPPHRFRINTLSIYCTVKGARLNIYDSGLAIARIVVERVNGGPDDDKWKIYRYDDLGVLISTWKALTGGLDYVNLHQFIQNDIVYVTAGYLFKTELVNNSTTAAISLLAYGIGGESY